MGLGAYGILFPPYVSLTTNSSIYGITPVRAGVSVGVVDAVNVYNSLNHAGDNCMFKITDAVLITAYGTQYWVTDEVNIIFKETPAP